MSDVPEPTATLTLFGAEACVFGAAATSAETGP